jgi:hypothetical protein
MKKLMTAVCMAGLMGAATAAQHGSMPMGKTGQSKMPNDKTGKPTHVTGCVAEGSETGRYILINATVMGDTTSKSYDLIGGDLKAHVGHTVEITGTIADGKAMGKDTVVAKDKTGAADTRIPLRVKSVKMHSVKCS